jgi:transcriptional regulator with XRE-family HTH domain
MPEKPAPGPLGQKLQALREQAGLTLYQLEDRSGIPRSRLFRLENGTTRQPTQDTLNKLAAALEVDPEEFLDLVWQDTGEPLPSLSTYFRSKFQFTDDQIAVIERAMTRAEAGPPAPKATPAARKSSTAARGRTSGRTQ